LHTLMTDRQLAKFFCVDGVITTVDAVNGANQLDAQPESVKQAAVADCIILTKTDLASAGQVTLLKERLSRLNRAALVLDAATADAETLFGTGRYDPHTKSEDVQAWLRDEVHGPVEDAAQQESCNRDGYGSALGLAHKCDDECHAHRGANRHNAGIKSHVLTFEMPLEWYVVSDWLGGLAYFYGEKLLRIKGILNIRGEAGPIAVHAVQHLFHAPTTLAAWPDVDRRSRIVFITRDLSSEVIDTALLRAQGASR
jgi:G3E family GTPase